jgi:hypothetical protein
VNGCYLQANSNRDCEVLPLGRKVRLFSFSRWLSRQVMEKEALEHGTKLMI